MSALADRLRAIVSQPGLKDPGLPADSVLPAQPAQPARSAFPSIESILGGSWREEDAPCFVVERRLDPSTRYGHQTIGELSAQWEDASTECPLLAAGAAAPGSFIFVDLETTGLSGGAGTYAFLVGCGWFDDGTFVTRQFVLTRIGDERPLLVAVTNQFSRAGALVSFNGKSFDAPVLETRYLFHRLQWIGDWLPHIDILPPARRFWGKTQPSLPDCSLIALEQRLLGIRRVVDVSGFEIPARYFHFLRSGDPRPLAPVLEHNRLDLVSLAGLSARLLDLLKSGPSATSDAREAFALGRVYARAGLESRAIDAYDRAAALCRSSSLKSEALRSLALTLRRMRRFDEAAAVWRDVLDVSGCPGQIAREANEALAIHHEHRLRDLTLAKAFAMRNLEDGLQSVWQEAVRYRVARIERKMRKVEVRSLTFEGAGRFSTSDF